MRHLFFFLCWLPAMAALPPDADPALASVDVFTAGQDGYHTYRIPVILQTARGTLLAFAEARKNSSSDWGDIDTVVKRSADGGRTWSKAVMVADFGPDTIGNPAPVQDRRTKTIWLLLTRNPGDVQEKKISAGISGPTRTVWVTHSRDDGLTWARPVDITAAVKQPEWSWYATGPVNGIQLRSGRMVIPCDHDRGGPSQRYSHVVYSDDGGRTWKLGGSAGPECNESTVAELADGSLMLNMRNYSGKNRRAVSLSRDGGLTWSAPVLDDALIEPVCQASLIAFGKGRNRGLLFSNPASTERVNMTVRLSRDGGKTWSASKTIHAGPSAYSNLVELKGKMAGLLYERGDRSRYEKITFTRFPIAWLAGR
ncbi:MAG: exo-alpha-sialidase [Bryobacteraceae bacterium]